MVNKITAEDLINKGVIGLPDVPGLTTIEMQKKLDEISIDVIIPRFNELIDNTVSASDEFSKLNTYNVGDYCIYQSVLYKCTTEITTAGEWDATKWKATAIDKELKEISSTPENKDAISDKYDSSKTYAVGDYCIYNDTLYKCKTAVTSAEEFDSSKWEATNCGKELVALNSNLSHYNPDTDSLDIYYNGELVGSLYLGFKEIIITLNDGSTSWVMVKEITGLSSGQYTFTVTANRTDSGAHDDKNAVGLSTTLGGGLTEYGVENSNRQLEYTKTYNIASVNDKIYVYIYNADASYKYSGKVVITKNS